jgi:hypothetical protein
MGLLTRIRDVVLQAVNRLKAPPKHREVPPPSALDAACVLYNCRYERSVFPTGEVQMMLVRPDASLSAVGPTTAAATENVLEKARKCWATL